jgi:cytochrome b561
MYAQVEAGRPSRPPLSSGVAGYRHSWILILPALAVGIGAVLHEPAWRHTDFTALSLHAIFGLLLWIAVTTQFLLGSRRVERAIPGAVSYCSRRLARQLYLVAYLLAATKALQYFAYTDGPGADLARSMQALQPYFGYALVALISVRAASYCLCPGSSCGPV